MRATVCLARSPRSRGHLSRAASWSGLTKQGALGRFAGTAARRSITAVISSTTNAVVRVGPNRLRMAGSAALVVWFIYWLYRTTSTLLRYQVPIGQDIRIYYRAVQLWLHGGDPWSATIHFGHATFSFAGSPATLLVLAPLAVVLSERLFVVVWLALGGAAAFMTVRWLRLPFWWLLFPPTVEALYSCNPQLVILALLLAGRGRAGAWADALAVAVKVYGFVPLIGERTVRRLIAAMSLSIVSLLIVPGLWLDYFRSLGAISARLAKESALGYSAFYFPGLLIPVVVVLVLLWLKDRRAAAWLAVPAVWPASEFHYSTLALPVMTPILAVLLAPNIQRLPPVAILVDGIWRLAGPTLRRMTRDWLEADRNVTLDAGVVKGQSGLSV